MVDVEGNGLGWVKFLDFFVVYCFCDDFSIFKEIDDFCEEVVVFNEVNGIFDGDCVFNWVKFYFFWFYDEDDVIFVVVVVKVVEVEVFEFDCNFVFIFFNDFGWNDVGFVYEVCYEFVLGFFVDVFWCFYLFYCFDVYDCYFVVYCYGFFLVVGDVDNGYFEFVLDFFYFGVYFEFEFGVEVVEGFVKEENFWFNY